MSGKFALIIANTEYTDPGLAQLTAPGEDAEDFARVLKDQGICAFDSVNILLNQPSSAVNEAVDEFFDQKKSDDLLLLYFSGHGVRDELGALYLAVKNTNRFRLRSTAVKSDYIRESMDQSRSKRQVLILDCCNSGAFAHGTKAATGVSIGTASAFEGTGYGRVVLTASDATQFAWEGDKVIGETNNSLFTHFLVKGLEGEADNDGDGRITIDELYDYAYDQIVSITPKQTPGKWSYKQQGEIVLRHNTRLEDIRPVSLPPYLINAIENPDSDVRLGAIQSLTKLLTGKNIGLVRSARDSLERLEAEDDSRRVSQAATQILEPIRQQESLDKLRAEQIDRGIVRGTSQAAQQALDSIRESELLATEKKDIRQKDFIEKSAGKQRRPNILKSIFALNQNSPGSKKIWVRAGLITLLAGILLVGLWIALPQLVFFSTHSASEEPTFSATQSVRIQNTNFHTYSAFLPGVLFELEVKTDSILRNQPCQVTVYLQRPDGKDLAALKTFTNVFSPYIANDGQVSVYANFVPSYDNSIWNIKLFLPYIAIAASGLPDGETSLEFYVELHALDNNQLIVRSSDIPFTFTR